ncbi:hypothetical protein [Nodularia sphaerocarpa]|uniref:hypothetical protein n=1 Tax=Nodularia sphaerocarpa TaxID=137816 RepID=UPI001EFBD83C|nr:hypothetical protein [Nodularia sphaerocarpa]MDB9376127.1 hypothetical protein [Nodularia sphaerocarpa CS-585]ULP73417.1 hypothetical protein BDGGKGIB_03070 [Nodularia sphaerocarpa UHCC 0038]
MALQIEFKNGWRLHSKQVSSLLGLEHSKIKSAIQTHYNSFDSFGWGMWGSQNDYWLEQSHVDLLVILLFKGEAAKVLMGKVHSEFTEFKTHQLKSGWLI